MENNVNALIDVPGRLNPVGKGNVIAGANTIWDDELGRRQSEINQEIENAVSGIRDNISGIMATVSTQVGTIVSEARNELSGIVDNAQQQVSSIVGSGSSQIEKNVNTALSQINSMAEVISNISQVGEEEVSLSVTPDIIFKGESTVISLVVRCCADATSIQILRGSSVISEGTGLQIFGEETVTATSDLVYTAKSNYGDISFTTNKIVKVVSPIYYGAGTPNQSLPPVESPEGIYHIEVESPDSYIIFNVPASMQIKSATMGSIGLPLEEPVSITVSGEEYKSYRSSNTYKVGSMTVVLT